MVSVSNLDELPENLRQPLIIEQQQRGIRTLEKELQLYKKRCPRPVILKQVIHHPARSRASQNLLGTQAWDEYVYE